MIRTIQNAEKTINDGFFQRSYYMIALSANNYNRYPQAYLSIIKDNYRENTKGGFGLVSASNALEPIKINKTK
jgi:hypothetical protein